MMYKVLKQSSRALAGRPSCEPSSFNTLERNLFRLGGIDPLVTSAQAVQAPLTGGLAIVALNSSRDNRSLAAFFA